MGSFFFTSNTWMWSLSLFPFMVGAGKTSLLLSFPLPYLQLSLQLAETTSTTPLYWNYSGITHKRPLSCHIQCMLFTLRIFFLHFLAFDSVGFSILRTPSYLSSSNILFFKYHSPDTSFCYFLLGLLFCSAFNCLYAPELCSWPCFLICLFILPTPCLWLQLSSLSQILFLSSMPPLSNCASARNLDAIVWNSFLFT